MFVKELAQDKVSSHQRYLQVLEALEQEEFSVQRPYLPFVNSYWKKIDHYLRELRQQASQHGPFYRGRSTPPTRDEYKAFCVALGGRKMPELHDDVTRSQD